MEYNENINYNTVDYKPINSEDLLFVITLFGLDITFSTTRKKGLSGYVDVDVEPNFIQRLLNKFVNWLNKIFDKICGKKEN